VSWRPTREFEQAMEHALDLSLGRWRDDLTKKTHALKLNHSRRGIHGTGAAANHAWSSVWSPAVADLPMRSVTVVMELFDAHGARLTKDAANWLSFVIETRFSQLTRGLLMESTAEFPPSGFRHHLLDVMSRLAIQARAEVNRRYDLVRLAGEGRVDQLVTDALSKAAMDEDLAERESRGQPFSAIYCDLDHFKALNDAHGHEAGNDALKAFGALLKEIIGDRGKVYRCGGDEFVILADVVGPEAIAIVVAVHGIQGSAITPKSEHIGSSAGLASFPADADNSKGVLDAADTAMRTSKKARGGAR
jgi:diguanylate cyclase (GGDEF)-like protein